MVAPTAMVPPDAAARHRALLDHDATLLVEAGAGTGKTALMAGRVALLLANGVPPREIVAITFTEAASSELRERIERFVAQLAGDKIPKELAIAVPGELSPALLENVQSASKQLDELTCTTIHGFCQQIVQAYPVETGIDPGAVIIDPGAADLAYDDLLIAWLSARFGRDRSKEGLGRLPPVPEMGEDDFFAELMLDDPDVIVKKIEETALYLRGKRSAQAPKASLEVAVLTSLSDAIAAFGKWYADCKIAETKSEATIAELTEFGAMLASTASAPLSGRALARLLLHTPPDCVNGTEPRFNKWGNKTKWKDAAKAAGQGAARGEQLNNEASAHYSKCSESYTAFIKGVAGAAIARFIAEFEPLAKLYTDYKRQAALLDFDDLLHHTRDLLAGHDAVRCDLARRYSRVLVDEFQDTDPLQAEILWLLCGEGDLAKPWLDRCLRPGSLFVVGDPKQAVYRFRGADVDTYLQAKAALVAKSPDAFIDIVANFRSLKPIIEFANAKFAPLLAEDKGQPGFKELAATREPGDAKPRVACIEIAIGDEQKRDGKLVVDMLRRAEAKRVADTVVDLIGRYNVWDKELQTERPCRAGDIALLAPTGTGLWIFERELEDREIPVASQAGKSFYTRQEVQDLIAVIRAISDRRDTLALGALLRGPLIGLTEEQIADAIIALPVRADGTPSQLYLWTDLAAITNPIMKRAFEVIQSLARKARHTTPHHLAAEAIEELNVRSVLRARYRQGAERALANIEMLLEMARVYDVRGIVAFGQALRTSWEDTERHVEGRPDADADAVSITTMHSSKGLEWPIVIPINSTTKVEDRLVFMHRRSDNTVHFKLLDTVGPDYETVKLEEQAQAERERVRLWYVALTRACDLLLLPRQSERTPKDWFSLLGTDLGDVPVFDSGDSAREEAATNDERPNEQDSQRWKAEAATIAALRRSVAWRSPSLHETTSSAPVAELVATDISTLIDTVEIEANTKAEPTHKIKGGRERGLVIHKLLEEVLTGETSEEAEELEARARTLFGELGVVEAKFVDAGVHGPEIASSVLRALHLDDIVSLRPRLIAEVTVFSVQVDNATTTFVGGVADALAVDASGIIDAVVDWKSDVDPSTEIVELYRTQVRDYLFATGAKSGLIVFVTSGRVEKVALA